MKKILVYLIFILIAGCIEPYNFDVKGKERSLVIEAEITDKSFVETLAYPSDGRYFTARLRYTGEVVNERPTPATGASVELQSDQDESWRYTETSPGTYSLVNPDFEAEVGKHYRLVVTEQDDIYESEWVALPTVQTPEMGSIGFTETEKDVFVVEANEKVMRTIKGVEPFVPLPPNLTGDKLYYRWEYTPMWIYAAPLVPKSSPVGVCWATNDAFLTDYVVQEDLVGGYDKPLFFINTVRNYKLLEKFSLLVVQYSMASDYFFFWNEMKDRATGSGINEIPPYNLKTNYTSRNPDKKVYGYFGVAQEQARRWYFSIKDLSYYVDNTLKADCLIDYGDGPADECLDCREYSDGVATTNRPVWWEN